MKLLSFKSALLVCIFVFIAFTSFSQVDIYRTKADARKDIAGALVNAKLKGKNVMLMFGGNWCPWCELFRETCLGDPKLAMLLENNYERVYVGARENKDVLIEYGSPNRFGYPAFVVLNSEGKLIHIQDSALLEEGEGYSKKKIITFFERWTVKNTK
ncbi:MAG: thioredoxin family protein [Marinifilaceae bacterium]